MKETFGFKSEIIFRPIGVIHSEHKRAEETPIQSVFARGCKGYIELFPEFTCGLKDIEGYSHLYLLYYFHKVKDMHLIVKPFLQDRERGIFSTRALPRPNPIGLSIVEFSERRENCIFVNNIDIIDGTPLIDIKPYSAQFDVFLNTKNGWQDEVDKETASIRGRREYKGREE